MLDDWNNIKLPIGMSITDVNTRQTRMKVCLSCDNLNSVNICKICNCFMPLKTWLLNKKCPVGKW
jgi:hypothetical protein